MSLRVLEAFAGLGGQALGWHRAGAEHVAFIERDPFARALLARHWPGVPMHEDVTTIDASEYRGRVDVLTGGPPCQPVSSAGLGRGTADDRWLWGAFVALAVAVDAPVVVAENPRGLLTAQGGDAMFAVLCAFGSAGYSVEWDMLAAGTLGAPHRRERVFLVARRDGATTWSGGQPSMFPGRPPRWPDAGRWSRHTLTTRDRQWPTPSPLPWEVAADASALPTPTTRDYKDGTAETAATVAPNALLGRVIHKRAVLDGGRLSPALPEWMMGLPADWSRPGGPSLVDEPSRFYLPDLTAQLALTTGRKHRRDRLRALGNACQVEVAEFIARQVLADWR